MQVHLGEKDYRQGGLERLNESSLLLRQELFAGSIYLGGRAVESVLRAVIWKHDPSIRTGKRVLNTGHNLREMLSNVANLGVLRDAEHRQKLEEHIVHISRLWFNNMRFVPTARLKAHWFRLGEVGGRRTLKEAAIEFFDACAAIVKRCEVLCQD